MNGAGTMTVFPGGPPEWQTFPMDRILMQRMRRTALPTREELRAWQLQRLRETLRAACTQSPFYAAHLSNTDTGDLRTLDDLTRLPRTTADHLRESGLHMVCVSQDEIARIVTLDTSGTSGAPKRLFFSQEDLDRTSEFFTIGMQAVACAGDTVLALLPDERPSSVGRLLAQSVLNMGAEPVLGGINRGGAALATLAMEHRAGVIVGSPLHVRTLAHGWRTQGLPKGIVHTVLLCWDAIPQAVVDLLHDTLGCRVLTHWGMTETGLGGALACAEQRGMHLRETDLLVEITEPATGLPVPEGDWGEITLTTLCRSAMPLIRYRTGDMGRIIPGPCACGSPLRRMDHSPGRLADDISLPDGTVLRLLDLDEALLPMPDVTDYVARWHAATTPTLAITLHATLPVAGHKELCAQAAEQLSRSQTLAASLAAGLHLAVSVADGTDDAMTYAKRRIHHVAPHNP